MDTIHEIVAGITEATPMVESRDNRAMVVGEVAHQGDVYVVRVSNRDEIYGIHTGLMRVGKGSLTENRQAAPGTSRGSRHMIEGDVAIYAPSQGASPLEGPTIEAESEWRLTHPEHAAHIFPAGLFVITYQRDFTAEGLRRVID